MGTNAFARPRSRGGVVRSRLVRRHGHVALVNRSLASRRIPYRPVERFYVSSFTEDPSTITGGDVTGGEDSVVRAAALEALGNMNGTVLAMIRLLGES